MKRLVIALTLVGALLGLGASTVRAGQQRPSAPVWSHVVAPGETLWDLARAAAPKEDPRRMVDRLVMANHLHGGTIFPGQRLVLPSH
jgi:LysM domain-containing protein